MVIMDNHVCRIGLNSKNGKLTLELNNFAIFRMLDYGTVAGKVTLTDFDDFS